MVEILYVKIDGLYSYGSEKNRINFGKRTVVVGANDSGKSSIFKALKFFLKCLTERDSTRWSGTLLVRREAKSAVSGRMTPSRRTPRPWQNGSNRAAPMWSCM